MLVRLLSFASTLLNQINLVLLIELQCEYQAVVAELTSQCNDDADVATASAYPYSTLVLYGRCHNAIVTIQQVLRTVNNSTNYSCL